MNSNERLEQLLTQFVDQQIAHQAADDIAAGDRLFERYPAPAVDSRVVGRIRLHVGRRARVQRLLNGLSFAGSAAAAAVIMFVMLHGFPAATPVLRDLPASAKTQSAHLAPQAAASQSAVAAVTTAREAGTLNLWKRLASHESLLQIDRELTDVADSINAIKSESYGDLVNTVTIDMLELEELELITANTDFWKG